MSVDHDSITRPCGTCGGPMFHGPLGLQCPTCAFNLAEMPEDEELARIAEIFPELRILEKVAQGGFGAVFRAEHRRMKRTVALKFLDSVLARSPEAVALFEQEMINVGRLDHPGIVRAHDAGEREGHWYLMMEYVDGMDCGALVGKHGRLPVAESCEIIRQTALALHCAHEHGLVHRDVKPGNIMVSRGTDAQDDRPSAPASVKVLDFGLAGLAAAPGLGKSGPTGSTSLFLGTLEYIAPEQIETPQTVDTRADIYSLGATLRRMLTGQPLRNDLAEMPLFEQMKRITGEPLPSIATVRPSLPRELTTLCDQMLELDRNQRPVTAARVAEFMAPWAAGADLPRLFSDGPLEEKPIRFPRKSRRSWWIGAAVAVMAAMVVGYFIYDRKGSADPVGPAASMAPAKPWLPIFSPKLTALRQLDEASAPRLLSEDWESESEIYSNNHLLNARFTADGRIVFLNRESDNLSLRVLASGVPGAEATTLFTEKDPVDRMQTFAISNDGYFVVGHQRDELALHIRRGRPDGSLLQSLRYDHPADFPPHLFDLTRMVRIKDKKSVFDSFPWGMTIVSEGQVPPNTGLSPGDILIADEGHMNLLPNQPSVPGLWRCRFDNDRFATRIGELPVAGHNPVDVAVSRHGVFLLNRTDVNPVDSEDHPTNVDRRVLRWDQEGFHACILNKPLYDPCGLAADPTSGDLYATQGAFIPTLINNSQRLLRLRPTTPDRYDVTVVAERFGRVGNCAIGFSADGQRMVVTDSGNRAIVVLKRKK